MKTFGNLSRKQKAVASMCGAALFLFVTIVFASLAMKGSILAIFAGVAAGYIACALADKANYEWLRHKRSMRAAERGI